MEKCGALVAWCAWIVISTSCNDAAVVDFQRVPTSTLSGRQHDVFSTAGLSDGVDWPGWPPGVRETVVETANRNPVEARRILEGYKYQLDKLVAERRAQLLQDQIPDWESLTNLQKRGTDPSLSFISDYGASTVPYREPSLAGVHVLKELVPEACVPAAQPLRLDWFQQTVTSGTGSKTSSYVVAALGSANQSAAVYKLPSTQIQASLLPEEIEVLQFVTSADSKYAPNTVDFKAIEINGDVYVIAVERINCEANTTGLNTLQGSRIFKFENNELIYIQTLPECFPRAVEFLEFGGEYYIFFANEKKVLPSGTEVYETDSHVYRWAGYHFNEAGTIPTSGPVALAAFSVAQNSRLIVCFANGRNDVGETSIYSKCCELDPKVERFFEIQQFATHAASDVEYLTIDSGTNGVDDTTTFLAFANEHKIDPFGNKDYNTDIMVYSYEDDGFVPFQCIPTRGGGDLAVYSGTGGRQALICQVLDEDVNCFGSNGRNFAHILRSPMLTKSTTPGLLRISIFEQESSGDVFLMAAHSSGIPEKDLCPRYPNIYRLKFELKKDLQNFYASSTAKCRKALSALSGIDVNALKTSVASLPKKTDEEIHVRGSCQFNNLDVSRGTLKAKTIRLKPKAEATDTSEGGKILASVHALTTRNLDITSRFRLVMAQIEDFSAADVGSQWNYLSNANIDCSILDCSMIAGIHCIWINEHSCEDLGNIMFTDGNYIIPYLEMDQAVIEKGVDILVLNGMRTADFLLKSANETILSSRVTFNNPETVLGGISVTGLVGGVLMKEGKVCLLNKSNHFRHVTFASKVTVDSVTINNVNGYPLAPILNNSVKTNEDRDVYTCLVFNASDPGATILSVMGDIGASHVEDYDVLEACNNSLMTNLSRPDAVQTISGNVEVDELKVYGNLDVSSSILGPGDDVGSPVVLDSLEVSSLEVGSLETQNLNGMNTVDGVHFPFVHVNWPTDQPITTPVYFSNVISEKPIEVRGTTNRVILRDLVAQALAANSQPKKTVYDHVIVEGHFNCKGDLALAPGAEPPQIWKDLMNSMKKNDPNPYPFEEVTFKKTPKMLNVTATWINDIDTRQLLTRDGNNDTISFPASSTLFITGNVSVLEPVGVRRINGLPAGDICTREYLMIRGDQNCTGTFFFPEGLDVYSIRVTDELIIKNMAMNVTSMTFMSKNMGNVLTVNGAEFYGLTAEHVYMSNATLDWRDPDDVFRKTLMKRSPTNKTQIVHSAVRADTVTTPKLFNDVLYDLLSSFCLTHKTFCMVHNVTIWEDVVAAVCLVEKTCDGVNFDVSSPDGFPHGVLTTGIDREDSQYFSGHVAFMKDIRAPAVHTVHGIRGVDIRRLKDDTIDITDPDYCGFLNNETIFSHVYAPGIRIASNKINGMDLNKVMTKSSPELRFAGDVTFTGSLHVSSDVRTRGLVNGHSLDELCGWGHAHGVYGSDTIIIDGSATFTKSIKADSLNGYSMTDLENIVSGDKDTTFTGSLHANTLKCNGTLTIQDGKLNNVDLEWLKNSLVNISKKEQENVSTPLHIDRLVVNGNVTGNVTLMGTLNGIPYNDIERVCFRTNGSSQTFLVSLHAHKCYFNDHLNAEYFNNVKMSNYMVIGRPNHTINCDVHLKEARIGELKQRVINGVDFSVLETAVKCNKPPSAKLENLRIKTLIAPEVQMRGDARLNQVKIGPDTVLNQNSSTVHGDVLVVGALKADNVTVTRAYNNHLLSDNEVLDKESRSMALRNTVKLDSVLESFNNANIDSQAFTDLQKTMKTDVPRIFATLGKTMTDLSSAVNAMDPETAKAQAVAFDFFLPMPFPALKSPLPSGVAALEDGLFGIGVQPTQGYLDEITTFTVYEYLPADDIIVARLEVPAFECKSAVMLTDDSGKRYLVLASIAETKNKTHLPLVPAPINGISVYAIDETFKEKLMQRIPSSRTSKIVQFSVGDSAETIRTMVFIANSRDGTSTRALSDLMEFSSAGGRLIGLREFRTYGAVDAAAVSSGGTRRPSAYFAVCNSHDSESGSYASNSSFDAIPIYKVDADLTLKNASLSSSVPNCWCVDMYEFEGKVLLVAGSNASRSVTGRKPELSFWKLDQKDKFISIQQISLPATPIAVRFTVFLTKELLCIVILDSAEDNVRIYRYMHAAGFKLEGTTSKPGASTLDFVKSGDLHHFLVFGGVVPTGDKHKAYQPTTSVYKACFHGLKLC